MSEKKNIKRNATRVKAKDRALFQSMQRNYKTKVVDKLQEKLL